jgi:hypothetical protein
VSGRVCVCARVGAGQGHRGAVGGGASDAAPAPALRRHRPRPGALAHALITPRCAHTRALIITCSYASHAYTPTSTSPRCARTYKGALTHAPAQQTKERARSRARTHAMRRRAHTHNHSSRAHTYHTNARAHAPIAHMRTHRPRPGAHAHSNARAGTRSPRTAARVDRAQLRTRTPPITRARIHSSHTRAYALAGRGRGGRSACCSSGGRCPRARKERLCAQTLNPNAQTTHPKPEPLKPHALNPSPYSQKPARARVQSVASGMREVDGTGLLDYCRRTIDRGADATAASDEEGDAEAD